jgi:hypothetical protein
MSNVHMMTSYCSNKECMARIRVGRILNKPALTVGSFQYCALCGSKALTMADQDETYWEVLAESYGYTVEIMKMLYNCWDRNKHYRFSDHVRELQDEIETEKILV